MIELDLRSANARSAARRDATTLTLAARLIETYATHGFDLLAVIPRLDRLAAEIIAAADKAERNQ